MSTNETTSNKGEQLSFYQLFSEKNWKIEIPIIQRDYAQGRESAKSIRNALVGVLHKIITRNENMDLDFVYGGLTGRNNDFLIPLDGQQRLTTLFLLHWYLATKENKTKEFQDFMLYVEDSNFTYATRASAREFCNALVKCEIDFNTLLEADGGDRLSKTLKDKPWYFESWDNDPTIKAMLNMLDTIDENFKNTQDLFDRLLNKEKPVITFQFLNFETLGLTDDLYIKMNARGKQLTDFENFKAKFEQFIKKQNNRCTSYGLTFGDMSQQVHAHKYFSHKIDTDWANLFWNYRNFRTNTFDYEIMNFFRFIITNHYALTGKDEGKNENLRQLTGKTGLNNNHTYSQYEELGCLNQDLVENLISTLDLLAMGDTKIQTYLKNTFYFDEEEVFKSALTNNASYTDKLRFYAMYNYLIQFQSPEGLADWMRVIYNLTENFIYNRPEEYVRSIMSIKKLLPHGKDILAYLVDTNNKIEGFTTIQIYEERLKANLILKSEEWRKVILDIEQHAFFTGQIGFILEFSGIVKYYQNHQNYNWNEQADSEYIEEFKNYSSKAGGLFKLIKESSAAIDFLWERAVLTKGYYLIGATSGRYNLLSSRQAKNNIMRDYSWKRLLRLSLSDLEQSKKGLLAKKRGYVKAVFDDVIFDVGKLKESLQEICDAALKNRQLKAWQMFFVRDKYPIEYCQQGFIRFDPEYDIQLLGQSQLNHYHAELRSYALYKNYISKNEFQPFTDTEYIDVKSRWEDACIVIDGANYKIEIKFSPINKQYEICFINSNYSAIHEFVQEILIDMQMEATNSNAYKYTKTENTESATINFLEELCEKLSDELKVKSILD